ncbi:hypothetical protein [Vibrio ishigakensis]|uniref:hypothetical protein n=1 Tax=Vibrio ishigakensis TaxID=1481914 RepID=UPI0021C46673|nr:hypothetical protein [Vibrio ishigakensis]
MSRTQSKSTLPNGKEGLFPVEVLDFDLSEPKLRKLVSIDSEKKLRQIEQLLKLHPDVFCEGSSLLWAHICVAARETGVPLSSQFLMTSYQVHTLELSIDNYLRFQAH